MKQLTIEDLKEQNLIIYEYIAGSTLYGLNTPTSDIDIRGVYITPIDRFYSVDKNAYQEQVSDDKNDTVYYELRKYLELLKNSNPNILESLNVPEDKILHKDKVFDLILSNKSKFISKEGIKPLIGYASSQIKKATGLNKKIVKQVLHKKEVLDFCYIPYKDGSTHVSKLLNDFGLKQE
ncbi:MAG: nucleotidyltransferase domain-containing protein, partial [Clostridia bacterium]